MLVVGGSLAGMAAAARLAKAGHQVALWEATDRLGGHLAARPGPGGVLVDVAPGIIGFPAPWRDLFRKSGRTLEAELARTKAELAPAGPAHYDFADGSSLVLSSDRGEQYVAMAAAYGAGVATRWRDLLDWLDDVWQAVRPLGLERELTDESQLSQPVRRLLRPTVTVADLATSVDHGALAALLRASAYRQGSRPEQTPAWAAVPLSVERRFGRWTVTAPAGDPDDRTGRTSTLVDSLAARLGTRRVDVTRSRRLVGLRRAGAGLRAVADDGTEVVAARVVYAADPWRLAELVTWTTLRRTRADLRRLSPASAPQVSHRLVAQVLVDQVGVDQVGVDQGSVDQGSADQGGGATEVTETIRLDPAGVPLISYRRPTSAGVLESIHDFGAARPDPAAGVAWRSFRDWFRKPPIRTELPGLFLAGPHTAAGGGLSPTLLAGALASYGVHDA